MVNNNNEWLNIYSRLASLKFNNIIELILVIVIVYVDINYIIDLNYMYNEMIIYG